MLWLALSDGQIASPIARPSETVTYTLVLTNDKGCVSQDTVRINVTQKIWIPNAFTPNGDSQNDTWVLPGTESYQDVEVSIYNRWGEMVFYSKGYSIPFDGTYKNEPLPVDTYVYRVVVPSKRFLFNGSLLITR